MVAAYSTVTPSTTAMPDSVAAEKARWLLRAPLVLPDAEGEGTAERAAIAFALATAPAPTGPP